VEERLVQGGKMQEKETLDEKLPGLFEPDTLLPIQYFEAMRKKHLLEGEKRLILSVLEDAVECYMKCIDAATSKGQRLFRDADEWINLEDKHWVFSFDNVCEMLDINPEYLRRGLRQWKERKLEAMERQAAERLLAPVEIAHVEPVTETARVTDVPGAEAIKAAATQRVSKVFAPRQAHRKRPAPAQTGSRKLHKAHA
jgi:transposase-like protein